MDANGLTAVDSTGVQRGNEGIDIGVWTPPGEPERAPLPGREHLIGVEYESLPKACPWLTERRTDLIFVGLALAGIYMGWMA